MLFAESLSGPEIALLGVAILFIGFLLRRSSVRGAKSRRRDVAAEVRSEILAAERDGASKIQKLELRLYEHSRDVEARFETRLAVLDRLVAMADTEICRLESLIDSGGRDGKQEAGSGSAPTPQQRRMIVLLSNSGYSPEEIAALVAISPTDVGRILDDDAQHADAA